MKLNADTSTNGMKHSPVALQVVIVSVTLAIVAITVFLSYRTRLETTKLAVDQLNDRQLILARSAARGIESYFKELATATESLAKLPDIQRINPRGLQCMQHTYWGFPPRTSIRLLDKKGILRLIYPFKGWRGKLVGRDYSKDAFFQHGAHGKRFGIHTIINERGDTRIRIVVPVYLTTQTTSISLTGQTGNIITPIDNDKPGAGEFRGVIIGSFNPNVIVRDFILPIASCKTCYAWMLDEKGMFLSHYRKDFIGQDAFKVRAEKNPNISFEKIEQIQRKMLAGKEGKENYVSGWHREKNGKIEKIIVYTPVHFDGKTWSIAICISTDDAYSLVCKGRKAEFYTLGFAMAVLIMGGGLFFMTSYHWSRSLKHQVKIRTKELKETGDYLGRLIHYANAPIVAWDPDKKMTIFNSAFERLTGKNQAQMLDKPIDTLFPTESRHESVRKIESTAKGRFWENVEIPILGRGDQVRMCLWNSANIYAEDEKTIIATIAQGQDITERKLAEGSISFIARQVVTASGEEFFRSLVKHLAMALRVRYAAICQWSDDKPTMVKTLAFWADGKFAENIEYPVDGVPCEKLKSGQICFRSRNAVRTFPQKKEQGDVDSQSYAGIPFIDSSGKITGHLEVYDDKPFANEKLARSILEIFASRAGAEQERLKADAALKTSEEQFRQAQKMEAIGKLAGGVAHDFNNQLTIVKGYSDLLLSAMDDDNPNRESVQEIRNASQRATKLTSQLLAFSRKQALDLEVINLNNVIEQMAKSLAQMIGEDIHLSIVPDEKLGNVRTDQMQFQQAIMNIVVNARDAMSNGGKLLLKTANAEITSPFSNLRIDTKPGHYVVTTITDTGTGMDANTLKQVFEPFFTTKPVGQGTGLGLAMVYGFVKQNGGTIYAYSELKKGTTFEIYLPRVDEPAQLSDEAPMETEPLPRGNETILVAEDSEAVRQFVVRTLRGCGYTVMETGAGDEALPLGQGYEHTIHLLITDVIMPQMSGPELAEKLLASRKDMQVLYISGYTDEAVIGRGVPDTDSNFLTKPFTPQALAETVRNLLDGN